MATVQLPKHKLYPSVFDTTAVGIARVYAQALYEAAAAANQLEAILEELDSLVSDVLDAHPEFERALGSAMLSRTQRAELVRRVFERRASRLFFNFLMVLNDHGRAGLLRSVLDELWSIYERRHAQVPVEVRSAVALDKQQQDALYQRVRGMLDGREPVLHVAVEPGLLGGLVVRIGDNVYDSSVRTRLRRARDLMLQRSAHEIQSRRDQFCHTH